MRRRYCLPPLALALAAALLSSASLPATGTALPSPEPGTDRFFVLADTWTCSVSGDPARTITSVGTRDADGIDVVRTVRLPAGPASTTHDRFTFDPATGAWRIDADAGSPGAAHLRADPWPVSAHRGYAMSHNADGSVDVLSFTLSGGLLFRELEHRIPSGPYYDATFARETCARGGSPPETIHCKRPNAPAFTTAAAQPKLSGNLAGGVGGLVQVLVSLDEASHVEAVRIQSSPSVLLNAASLEAARTSTFQTALRDCRPIAADYVFSIDYML